MMQSNAENIYLISRTEYNTHASLLRGGEWIPLLKDGETMPAYLDSRWADRDTAAGFRRQLGIPEQGRCIVTCEYGPFFEASAAVFRRQLEDAGFPNVTVVADIYAVMAYYEEENNAVSAADPQKGIVILNLRYNHGEIDGALTAELRATLCRGGHSPRTASVTIYEDEDHSRFEIPESFFEKLRGDWGEVSSFLYHGYYPIEKEMVRLISGYFKDAAIHDQWAEIQPYHRKNLHRGLELLVCRSEHSLLRPLDELFQKRFLPYIKRLSDVGQYIFDALEHWIDGQPKLAGIPECADECLENYFQHITGFNPYWQQQQYRQDAESIAQCCAAAYSLEESAVSPELFLIPVQHVYEHILGEGSRMLLQGEIRACLPDFVAGLTDRMFWGRRRQIEKKQDQLRRQRRICRAAVLPKLADRLDLPALRARFIREILQEIHSIPKKAAVQLAIYACETIDPGADCIPSENAINRLLGESFPDVLIWRDDDPCFGVDTSIRESSCSTSHNEPDTPAWEYID